MVNSEGNNLNFEVDLKSILTFEYLKACHCFGDFFGTVSLHGFIEILHSHGVCSNQTETQRLAVRQGIRPPHRDLTAWEAVKVMHIATRF